MPNVMYPSISHTCVTLCLPHGDSYATSRGNNGGVGEAKGENLSRHAHESHQDLIGFFGHKLLIKIRIDRKHLTVADFSKIWMQVESLVRVNRTNFSFLL